ncbi:MAG: ATP-dependent DNA ligase [archaeon]
MEYSTLAEYYKMLEETSLKTEKTRIVSVLFEKTRADDIEQIAQLLMGRAFPSWSEEVIGIASNLMIKAISKAYGIREDEIVEKWKDTGDLGTVVEELSKNKKQRSLFEKSLLVSKVYSNLRKIAMAEGVKSQDKKLVLIAELLSSAKPIEARFIVRTVLGDLRVGVAEGIVRDAIAKAFFADVYWRATLIQKSGKGRRFEKMLGKISGKTIIAEDKIMDYLKSSDGKIMDNFLNKNTVHVRKIEDITCMRSFFKKEQAFDYIFVDDQETGSRLKKSIVDAVEEAYEISNDFGIVAKMAEEYGERGLSSLKIEVMKPLRVMLAQKAETIDEAFLVVGKPAALEYKYDGFRMQIHKKGDEVRIYTRRLENVTDQFPDVVSSVKEGILAKECIIEGETVGLDTETGKMLPFQKVSKRIRRKYDITKTADKIPVVVNLFDILYLDGKMLLKRPFLERRGILKSVVREIDNKLVIAKQKITDDPKVADEFYKESLTLGNEGLMFKNIEGPYKPGSRVGHMIKLKPIMETLDLVIVGAEWGKGKRSGWLSSFMLACRDEETGSFLTIGKMGTGIKEKQDAGMSFDELTEMLREHILREKKNVADIAPFLVLEVAYEEIQKSPNYSSGYALRFPRMNKVRDDRGPEEADSLFRVEELFRRQRGRN